MTWKKIQRIFFYYFPPCLPKKFHSQKYFKEILCVSPTHFLYFPLNKEEKKTDKNIFTKKINSQSKNYLFKTTYFFPIHRSKETNRNVCKYLEKKNEIQGKG